jgi:hypothetical protein
LAANYERERFVVGAAFDYSHEDTQYKRNAGTTDTNEFGLQLIGIAYPIWDLYLAGTARFAYDDYETKRRDGEKGDPDGFKISVAGGPGYDFNLGRVSSWDCRASSGGNGPMSNPTKNTEVKPFKVSR